MFMQFGTWCFLYFWVCMHHFKLIFQKNILWIFLFYNGGENKSCPQSTI